MATLFISSSKASSASSFSVHQTMSLPRHTAFSEYMMEESVDQAHAIITKWDTKSPTSLFHENRKEGREFLKCVKDLRTAMHFFLSQKSASGKLVLAQQLMQIAMKRLEKEFYQILSANRDRLDPDSVRSCVSGRSSNSDDDQYQCDVGSDEEINVAGESISEVERVSALAMYDLKAIADCMIGCGYGKECVKIYKIIRKSIVDEGLYRIGIERNSSSQISKMNFEALQHKIKHWLSAVRIAVKTLFMAREFSVIMSSQLRIPSGNHPLQRSPEKEPSISSNFRSWSPEPRDHHRIKSCFLDLYEAISDLLPEIELIFSFESTSAVRLQVSSSLQKLSEAVRATLSEFESVVQKDSSKTLVTGGGIHPLTESAMNYISSLANYSGVSPNPR
ncbi:Exocyst complex component EXO70H1 [Vitis vinifera]|uniref:Exocyst subunit Exo70 family protein n=1 Tax=Vitis vinifera TaxID=29760 RepID=A0A438EP56_VITVI|nr:Exocyst complex component EXO70H1 [Vitis vinifera]